MLNTEQIFDALPYVVDIYETLDLKKAMDKMRRSTVKGDVPTAKEQREMGEQVIMYLLKNTTKCKASFFPFLAIILGCTEEEAKQTSLSDTITALKGIAQDEDLMRFFKTAIQSA